MNPFIAQLATERMRDLRGDYRSTRVVRRRRPVRSFISRSHLGPTHNYVHH